MLSEDVVSQEEIRITLAPYGFGPSQGFCAKTGRYVDLLQSWNRRISLTTVTARADILRFHFGESLFALQTGVDLTGRLADVGSGAGFPGLVLAIALPGLDVTLIESNQKKVAFLLEVIRSLDLRNARVLRGRAADMRLGQEISLVTARAVGNYPKLLAWAKSRVPPGRGRILLWLSTKEANELGGVVGWDWISRSLIPGTRERLILVGSPQQ